MRILPSCFLLAGFLSTQVLALWPAPRQMQSGSTMLRLSTGFNINANFQAPSDLQEAMRRAKQYVKEDGLAPLVVDRGASQVQAAKNAKLLSVLTLSLNGGKQPSTISSESVKAIGSRDESYSLNVPSDGSPATLSANTTLGLYRGLATFSQLWYTSGGQTFMTQTPLSITDRPAFPYRGFLLDTARNFFPMADIKRTLDAMSWVKINQLHWHVVDSQSFPLQVPGFMDLSQKGAYDASQVYTTKDVQEIVSYAAARGIDVLVEIDTPGHTAVIAKAHPEHIACAEAKPWATFANEPPAGQLRLASPATVNYTANLLTAVAKMFPSTLMSTGGDEINQNCYNQDAETVAAMSATGSTFEQALDKFTQVTHQSIIKEGKTPVVWEEMVLEHDLKLANTTIAMVWISSANVAKVAQKGFRLVHAASDFFYLDCGGGGWVGQNTNGNSWCDPFKTWQKGYSFDPYANLSNEQRSLVLGGQHLLWTEQSSPTNLDPIAWPRAATSAEVFWTGATLPNGSPRSAGEALPRLHDIAYRMQARGVKAIALQPLWCALRPGACDLTA